MRKYKIAKVCGLVYTKLIRDYYSRNRHLAKLGYEEHKLHLKNFFPVHLNKFSDYMTKLGHECTEFIYDLQSLQQAWASENGCEYGTHSWQLDILLKQIETYRPEILYLQDVHGLPHSLRVQIREIFPFVKKVIMFKGYPGRVRELRDIDLILAGTPLILEDYRKENLNAELFYHSFDPDILNKKEILEGNEEHSYDFTFMGCSGYSTMHVDRFDMLRKLGEKTDLQFWLMEDTNQKLSSLDKEAQPISVYFPDRTKFGRFGLEMYRILRDSKVTFNKHTEAVGDVIGNMRLFEATGVGCCLLTDTGKNMQDLFDADKELVTYETLEECQEKVRFLLENESERMAIAEAGQKRTLLEHSLPNRCAQLDELLQTTL